MIRKLLCGAMVIFFMLMVGMRIEAGATPIECMKEGEPAFHYHVDVSLVLINDDLEKVVPLNIPPSLGFKSDSCVLEIHTHDNSGKLHIESTIAEKVFTVSDLFKYMEKELLVSLKNHDGSPPLLAVNKYLSMSHWRRIQGMALEDEMKIVIFLRVR